MERCHVLSTIAYKQHLDAFLRFVPEQPDSTYIQILQKSIDLHRYDYSPYEFYEQSKKLVQIIEKSIYSYDNYANALITTADAAERCGYYKEQLDYAQKAESIAYRVDEGLSINCILCYGEALIKNNDYKNALAVLEPLSELLRKRGIVNDLALSRSLSLLGLVWYSLNRNRDDLKRAKRCHIEALDKYLDYQKAIQYKDSRDSYIIEKRANSDNLQISIIYSNLAAVLKELGDFWEAKNFLEKAISSAEANFGQDHPITAVSYSNLATVLQDLGDYAGAKALLEKAMRSDEANFGQDHPTTARSYSNLALVLKDLGDYAGAKALLEKAMRSNEANFGQDHPTTAVSYHNLADVLIKLEQYADALLLERKAYGVLLDAFGDNHPYTRGSMQVIDYLESAI